MPSRLLSAFPAGVPIRRIPLDEAIARVTDFRHDKAAIEQADCAL